jgi:hypothetical protein
LRCLTGREPRAWTLQDFEMRPPRRRARSDWDEDDDQEEPAPDEGQQNLNLLAAEFVAHVHAAEGVAYTRAELARHSLCRYLVERHDGGLEPRESMIDAVMHPRKHRPRPARRPPLHPLCPDRATLDRYLAGLLGFLNVQVHEAVATLELVPAWLRFLEGRQLLAADVKDKVLAELRPLVGTVLEMARSYRGDPALEKGLSAAWVEGEGAAGGPQASGRSP